jgi:hypothetical protein
MIAPEVIIPAAAGLAGVVVGSLMTWFISEKQRITAFRTAALERRLATHQEGFRLWHEMIMALDRGDEGARAVGRCQQWWYDNCLYLDAQSRKEFIECARDAGFFRMTRESQNTAEKAALLKRLKNVLRLIEEGVHLPPVGEASIRPKDAKKE